MLPLRPAAILMAVSCAALGVGAGLAAPLRGPASCALELRARDASGNTVLSTVAYALDSPGLALASLSAAANRRPRWENLDLVFDAALSGEDDERAPIVVTEVLLQDPSRDLLLLRAPGLPACDAASDQAVGDLEAAAASSGAPVEGDPFTGIRNRDGYSPRVFQARLDRMIAVGTGPDLLRVRIGDGGGAASGFLFDRHQRLVGSILPPPPGGDRLYACAVPIDRRQIDVAASRPGDPVIDALARPSGDDASSGAPGLLARALLLTRDDQVDQAVRFIDEAARIAGASDVLLMERGNRLFRIGRTDAAIADFSRAALLNPRMHVAEFNLGVAFGSEGRYEEAIDAFRRAAAIDPGHGRTHYQLALALAAARQGENARRECDVLSEIDPALARDLRAALSY